MVDIKIVTSSVMHLQSALKPYAEKGYVPVGGICLTGRTISVKGESVYQPEAMVMMVCEVAPTSVDVIETEVSKCIHTHRNEYGRRTVVSACGQRFYDISQLMASNANCPNCGKLVFNEYK